MTLLEEIEEKIATLSDDDLARLREWFDEFDEAAWDRQIEQDYKAGRFDAVIAQACLDDDAGKSTPL